MYPLDLSWVHAFYSLSFTLSVCGDEVIHVPKATTDTDDQLVIHDLDMDLLGSKNVVAIIESGDGHVTTLDIDHIGQHLIHLVSLHCSVLLWLAENEPICFVDFGSCVINLLVKDVSIFSQLLNLLLTLHYHFLNNCHLLIKLIQLLEVQLVLQLLFHDCMTL